MIEDERTSLCGPLAMAEIHPSGDQVTEPGEALAMVEQHSPVGQGSLLEVVELHSHNLESLFEDPMAFIVGPNWDANPMARIGREANELVGLEDPLFMCEVG